MFDIVKISPTRTVIVLVLTEKRFVGNWPRTLLANIWPEANSLLDSQGLSLRHTFLFRMLDE